MENVVAILIRERATAVERCDALSSELRELRQRVREIDDAVALLSGHTPCARPPRASGGDLKALILACVQTYGRDGVTARDVAASLTAGGRETSEPSVSSTLSRMKAEREVENRHGKWFAKIEGSTEFDDVLGGSSKTEEAPSNGGASQGRVAELEVPARSEQRPIRIGENVGSSPIPPSPIVKPSAFDADLDDDVPF